MTQRPPGSDTERAPDAADFDVSIATEQLFDEIAIRSGNPLLASSLNLMRDEARRYRQYEDALLPDREAEYQRLLDCWRRQDKAALQKEIAAYFGRREAIADQIARLIDRPN